MVSKMCHICGKAADRTCSMCGRPVCANDFDSAAAMCTICRSGRRIGAAVKKAG